MKYHQGRLIDHIGVYVSDLELSKAFYLPIFDVLGKSDGFSSYENGFHFDEFYVEAGDKPITNLHLAFQANSIEEVHTFYQAELKAGGIDNGKPGYREYHDAY